VNLPASTAVGGNVVADSASLAQSGEVELTRSIKERIQGITHDVLWPEGVVDRCPDLCTALYWQFASLMSGKRRVGICKVCQEPFIQTRKDKKVCGSGCRTAKSRSRADG
jgi:hypothetical protein